jgi:2-polyprenyl-3-methyl-5-hydroxy-6-metoxy-1,4-benzoquinol methylase
VTYPPAPLTATPTADLDETRFAFGKNWDRFARDLPPARIANAVESLTEMLGTRDLSGLSFLDLGSGSGLSSLAAALSGAARVHSLDYDPASVATTTRLRDRFAPDVAWKTEQASVLDAERMASLGHWNIVYSWGVLHHTGDMWNALGLAAERVAPNGRLFVSIYNDQGLLSRLWSRLKRVYNLLPEPLRVPYAVIVSIPGELSTFARKTLKGSPAEYFREWRNTGEYTRGMSRWHDLIDWVGGYPFEVAKPEQVIDFCLARGFELERLRTVRGSNGCNEFVFRSMREEPS